MFGNDNYNDYDDDQAEQTFAMSQVEDIDELQRTLGEAKDFLKLVVESEGGLHSDDVIEIKRFLQRNQI